MNRHLRSVVGRVAFTLVSAIVAAQCGGSTAAPSAPAPVVPVVVAPPPAAATAAALSSISFSTPTVVGGSAVIGTATLTTAAPIEGASVALTGGNESSVPATVFVMAGASTATFTVSTRSVADTVVNTIGGSYGGKSATAALSITRQTIAVASFGVAGSTESDTCSMANEGKTLACTFNGSTSSAPGTIVSWDWTFAVAGTFTRSSAGPVLTQPAIDCSLLPDPSLPHDYEWFPLTVTLTVRDSLGNVSAPAINRSARVFPEGTCGFPRE
jgi:hypothetical protein